MGALGGPASLQATLEQQEPTGTVKGSTFGGSMVSNADYGGTVVVNEDGPGVPNVIHAAHESPVNPADTMVVSSALGRASLNQVDGPSDYLAALHAAASANDG